MSEKHLEVLLDLTFDCAGFNTRRSVCKRRGLEVLKEKNSWGSASQNYDGAIKKAEKELDSVGKLRLAFEFLIDSGYESFRDPIKRI